MTTRLVAPLQRAGVVRSRPGLSVLMYHGVNDDPEPETQGYYRLNTPVSLFQRQMDWLQENGFRTIGLHEVPAMLLSPSGMEPTNRLVVITFDDGYKDFLQNAWPAMNRHGFTGTVFLPTAYIGNETMLFRRQPCLTWAEVRDLRKEGVFFGPHTVTHRELNRLSWEDAAEEITRSKQQVEEALGEAIPTFSHPYGFPAADRSYVERYCSLLERLQVKASVTTLLGRVRAGISPLLLPRLPVNGIDALPLFSAKMRGAYDWLSGPQRIMKRMRLFLGDG
ncbi:MAG: polysaccharide deacetylase family protein [Verrucomicrobia bacterium]|nr:polysaccharide deacetylase family protein [Verrucomicrobiota bacterium]MBI3869527.1 polysaccharide deacetylase family protein [Verrucomicrobiota bacterium]